MSFYCQECRMQVGSMSYHRSLYHEVQMESTHEERMKVRRDECRVHGHSWDAQMLYGDDIPAAFVCSNCGRSITVVETADDKASQGEA